MGSSCECFNSGAAMGFIFADSDCGRLLEGERLKKLAEETEGAKAYIVETSAQRRLILSDDFSPLTADLCGILTTRLRGMISVSPQLKNYH